jgi:dihydroflavonol-4-reductase
MKILVTGASGFIGSALCRALVNAGHHVRAFHRASSSLKRLGDLPVEHAIGDLTQPNTLSAAVEGIDVIFHTAALMGTERDPGRLYSVTVEGTRSLLKAAHQAGIKRFIHTSSVAALGVPEEPPYRQSPPRLMDENHTWNFSPQRWRYGYAKYLAELEVQRAVAQGLDAVIVNPTIVIGAGDIYRATSSYIVQVALQKLPILTRGGLNTVHLDDVVEGHLAALAYGKRGERYILGGFNMTIAHFIQKIAEVIGVQPPAVIVPPGLIRAFARPAAWLQAFLTLPVDPSALNLAGYYFYVSTQKAHQELHLAQPRPIEDAILQAYHWFQETGALPSTPFRQPKTKKTPLPEQGGSNGKPTP